MYIYKIINKTNGDFYIGKTVHKNPNKRWTEHKGSVKYCQRHNKPLTHFQFALLKYGEESFIFEVIEEVNKKENLNEREIYWIAILKPHYNMTAGGEGISGMTPYIRTKEIKEKLSSSKRNKKWIYNKETLEEKQIYLHEISEFNENWKLGRSPRTHHGGKRGEYTKERAEKLAAWRRENTTTGMTGKKHTKETKETMSKNISKLIWVTEKENKKHRRIKKEDFNENIHIIGRVGYKGFEHINTRTSSQISPLLS